MSSFFKNYSLKKHNTFGIAVTTKYYTSFNSSENLLKILQEPEIREERIFILGGGSNILFVSDFDGIILENKIKGIESKALNNETVLLSVNGGEIWDDVVKYAVDHEYYGIENLSLIPGSAGAAPLQNIGAYGVELKDVFHSLEGIFFNNLKKKTFYADECKFGYRDSIFKQELKGEFIITEITLQLSTKKKTKLDYRGLQDYFVERDIKNLSIKEIREAVISIRKSKLPDPMELGNAGSYFKNPKVTKAELEKIKLTHPKIQYFNFDENHYKIAAGWLIEQCGLKGKRVGNVGTHNKQALVIVNYGGATGKQVVKFAEMIQQKVEDEFGILLEPEVNLINNNEQELL